MPISWLLGLIVVIVALVAYSTVGLRMPVSVSMRRVLTLLRVAFLLALVFLLTLPRVTRTVERPRQAHVAVLVDDSQSMSLAVSDESGAQARIERAKETLQQSIFPGMSDRHVSYSMWRMSDLSAAGGIEQLSATASQSPIRTALRDLFEKFDPAELNAVVLLSDGQDTSDQPEIDSADLHAPVYTVGFGSTEEAAAVKIEEVILPERAYRNESIPIQAVISRLGALGEDEMELQLRMLIDGAPEVTELVVFSRGQSRIRWSTQWVFKSVGEHRVTFEISVLSPDDGAEQDANDLSDQKDADIEILKDRYNCLLVSGSGGWELKFVRRSLEEDPRVDVTAVWPSAAAGLIVVPPRMEGDIASPSALAARAMKEASSLEEVFENLGAFDLLILGSVKEGVASRKALLPEQDLEVIREWVDEDGGRLLVYGGKALFSAGEATLRTFSDMMPVRFAEGNVYRTQSVFPRLTESGQRTEALESLRRFDLSRLPPLQSWYRVEQAKPGATVLLETPEGIPLLAWHPYGAGRVMALTTDATWHWGLPLAETETRGQLTGQLWRQLARFLLMGKQGGALRIYTDGNRYQLDEQVSVSLYLPAGLKTQAIAERIPLLVEHPEGQQEIILTENPYTPGLFEGTFRPQHLGETTLRVSYLGYQDEKRIVVERPAREFRQTAQNVALLTAIAERSGGEYVPFEEAERLKEALDFAPEMESITRAVFLGSLPWVLPLLIAIITVEWILRKRVSLP